MTYAPDKALVGSVWQDAMNGDAVIQLKAQMVLPLYGFMLLHQQ